MRLTLKQLTCTKQEVIYEKYGETGSSKRAMYLKKVWTRIAMQYGSKRKKREGRKYVRSSNEISWESCKIQHTHMCFRETFTSCIQGSFSTHDQSPSLQIYFQKALCTCNCSWAWYFTLHDFTDKQINTWFKHLSTQKISKTNRKNTVQRIQDENGKCLRIADVPWK